MSNFDNNWRRKQEIRMRPVADKIYEQIFGDGISIDRFEQEDNYLLDKEFATDAKVRMSNGMILLGQEKFLSHRYAKYESVTVEYEQNQFTGEEGDWFKLGVQFYFVGYCTDDDTDFAPWIMLNWPAVVLLSNDNEIPWRLNRNKDGRAKASFYYCSMAAFPQEAVISSSWEVETN